MKKEEVKTPEDGILKDIKKQIEFYKEEIKTPEDGVLEDVKNQKPKDIEKIQNRFSF
jgi:hypothetical protein